MDIDNRNALVLGGYGLVGMAVCRELLARRPARLVVTSAEQIQAAFQSCRERNVLSLLGDEPLASAAAAEWKRP